MARVSTMPPATRTELVSVDPATLAVVGRVPVTTAEEIGEIVAEASLAQEAWARRPLGERARVLQRLGHLLVEQADELARTIVSETGKPIAEALTSELLVCLDSLTWLARNTERVLRPERIRHPLHLVHKRAWLCYEPIGVVAVVSPWNFPLAVPLTQAAAAVAAGNAAVLKPSELTPLTGACIERLFLAAGAPAGLVRVVQGSGETAGASLVAERGVGHVVFTGSSSVGREVARHAAERLCPVTLELGGKDPMLVLDDVDLDRAVDGALWASFTNCGQVCSGVERIYVSRELYPQFVSRLAERAAGLRIGHGHDPGTELGPLVSEQQRMRVEALVADAVEHGSEILTGGERPLLDLPGWFHTPTVLAGEPGRARIAREEIFGPVVTVVSIENEEDGIRRANSSSFGLGASVWTRDRARARRVGARLQAGSVWMNDHAYSYGTGQAPWGGRKESGYGCTHSRHGLYGLTRVSYRDADSGRSSAPWWYPYSDRSLDGFAGALRVLYDARPAARAAALLRHGRGLAHLARKSRLR